MKLLQRIRILAIQRDVGVRRPQIGVVSSWGEINPGSVHLDKITQFVKDGIWAAGGTPREFVISSICTSMAGHDNYHLPHRGLVAGYIETVAMTNLFDAMVYVPVCDDVVPGHLMALGPHRHPLYRGHRRLHERQSPPGQAHRSADGSQQAFQ